MSGKNLKDISHVERNRVSMYVVGVVAFQKLSSSARLSSPSSQSLLQNNRNVGVEWKLLKEQFCNSQQVCKMQYLTKSVAITTINA